MPRRLPAYGTLPGAAARLRPLHETSSTHVHANHAGPLPPAPRPRLGQRGVRARLAALDGRGAGARSGRCAGGGGANLPARTAPSVARLSPGVRRPRPRAGGGYSRGAGVAGHRRRRQRLRGGPHGADVRRRPRAVRCEPVDRRRAARRRQGGSGADRPPALRASPSPRLHHRAAVVRGLHPGSGMACPRRRGRAGDHPSLSRTRDHPADHRPALLLGPAAPARQAVERLVPSAAPCGAGASGRRAERRRRSWRAWKR